MLSYLFVLLARTIVVSLCFAALSSSSPASSSSYSQCRYLPGDVEWPNDRKWAALNSTVRGRLIKTIQLGSPCHDPTYNETQCNSLKIGWPFAQTQYVPQALTLETALLTSIAASRRPRLLLHHYLRTRLATHSPRLAPLHTGQLRCLCHRCV